MRGSYGPMGSGHWSKKSYRNSIWKNGENSPRTLVISMGNFFGTRWIYHSRDIPSLNGGFSGPIMELNRWNPSAMITPGINVEQTEIGRSQHATKGRGIIVWYANKLNIQFQQTVWIDCDLLQLQPDRDFNSRTGDWTAAKWAFIIRATELCLSLRSFLATQIGNCHVRRFCGSVRTKVNKAYSYCDFQKPL